jgi:phospholipid/cholesterol/gamma-HCH transport system substrate-binding protein
VERAREFKVGVFVLAALVLMMVLVVLFSGFPALFTQHDRYTIVFATAANVGPGTPVRRSGVPIGEVESIHLDEETGEVRVIVLINRKYSIRTDEVPILSAGLLGDTTIDFVRRTPPDTRPATTKPDGGVQLASAAVADAGGAVAQAADDKKVPPGSVIKGVSQTDAQALINQVNDLMPLTRRTLEELGKAASSVSQIAPVLDEAVREIRDLSKATREAVPEMRKTNDEIQVTARNWGKLGERLDVLVQTNQEKLVKTLEDLDTTLVRIGNTFNEENQKNLAGTLRNVRSASDNLENITKGTDALIQESRATMQRVNSSVQQADVVLQNLQRSTKPMAERSDVIMRNLDEATDRLNRVLIDTQELLRVYGRGDGTIQRLLSDPALYQNLNDAACALAKMMPRVDRMLRDFEIFADKLARHPEAIGIGGAVRPGSGIK